MNAGSGRAHVLGDGVLVEGLIVRAHAPHTNAQVQSRSRSCPRGRNSLPLSVEIYEAALIITFRLDLLRLRKSLKLTLPLGMRTPLFGGFMRRTRDRKSARFPVLQATLVRQAWSEPATQSPGIRADACGRAEDQHRCSRDDKQIPMCRPE